MGPTDEEIERSMARDRARLTQALLPLNLLFVSVVYKRAVELAPPPKNHSYQLHFHFYLVIQSILTLVLNKGPGRVL